MTETVNTESTPRTEGATGLQQMQEILDDLHAVLENEDLLWNLEGQTHPEHFDFAGIGALLRTAHDTAERSLQAIPAKSPGAGSTPKAQAPGRKAFPEPPVGESMHLAANQKCTLCKDRIYATRRFYIRGRKPILVIHFEGPFARNADARDRSEKLHFATEQEDDLFQRMIERLGFSMQDLHFQQLPACHFVAETSTADDWNERTLNCLTHLEDTIKRENIKLALITGPAAILLFGEEGAKQFSESGELIPMPVNTVQVGATVLRSPAAILSLEARTKKAQSSGDQEAYKKARDQEIQVKKQILANLEKALSTPGIR